MDSRGISPSNVERFKSRICAPAVHEFVIGDGMKVDLAVLDAGNAP
jgi:hypothetical protein